MGHTFPFRSRVVQLSPELTENPCSGMPEMFPHGLGCPDQAQPEMVEGFHQIVEFGGSGRSQGSASEPGLLPGPI